MYLGGTYVVQGEELKCEDEIRHHLTDEPNGERPKIQGEAVNILLAGSLHG